MVACIRDFMYTLSWSLTPYNGSKFIVKDGRFVRNESRVLAALVRKSTI